jgi:hypothetical protein
MLVSPRAGVGGVDCEQADAVAVGLPAQAVAEHRRRDTGHRSAVAFAALPSAHSFAARGAGIGKVKVFHGDGRDVVPLGVVEEPGDRVPDLSISTAERSREVEVNAVWRADWVAVLIEASHGEVSVVEVHPH